MLTQTMDIVRHGYKVPLKQAATAPGGSDTVNNKSSRDLQQFAWEKLLRLNCVRRVGGPSKVELPLSVVYSNKLGLLVGGGWKPLHESVCDCTAVFDT